MTDSAIAFSVFGSDKAVLATDVSAGLHTLKVTTASPSDGIVISGFGAAKYVIGTVKSGGVHTLCATTDAPNSAIALKGAGSDKLMLATVASGGVHVPAVTTNAGSSAVLINAFGLGVTRIATVLSGGVHTLAVTDTSNGGIAINTIGYGKNVVASAQSLGVHRLSLSGLAPPFDPDAQAYIDATGELFPEALNDLVTGIKAAGLWDTHIGSIKKAIGVPTLTASMVDLRNTAFNGTPINAVGHSATAGWTFLQASSQYIDDPWGPGIASSNATQNDCHWGVRVKSALATGGSFGRTPGRVQNGSNCHFGFEHLEPGFQNIALNDSTGTAGSDPGVVGHYIGSRTGTTKAFYQNGSLVASATVATTGINNAKMPIGADNTGGAIGLFFTGRISVRHGGANLTAGQAATVAALVDAYATAAGET